MDCAGEFTTETEDELMKHVQLHAAEAHPDLEITPEFAEQIGKLVRSD
jgi:predicted small metal-binding protein